jgi:hypothetical protein
VKQHEPTPVVPPARAERVIGQHGRGHPEARRRTNHPEDVTAM